MKTSATSASVHLFKTREGAIFLEEAHAKIYHNFFFKELFATNRARPDIHAAVSFLIIQVRAPYEVDWKKLSHMMSYIHGKP